MTTTSPQPVPGPLILFGSGETSASGGKAHEYAASSQTPPLRAAILETPAGFELNSPQVAGNLGDFVLRRLQNYRPQVSIIPARTRSGEFSTQNPALLPPIFESNYLFLGPGSPTYAVRQLRGTAAYYALAARHRLGAPLLLASAAALAFSAYTLPVYEIYKVGEDLYWKSGLNFLKPFGLPVVFIPHWNNSDGGDNLDTSRCFMGKPRFEQLLTMLPAGLRIVGIDEHTALAIEFSSGTCRVFGVGGVTIVGDDDFCCMTAGSTFPLDLLGSWRIPRPRAGIPPVIWQRALDAQTPAEAEDVPPPQVFALLEARQQARTQRNWSLADELRRQIAAWGWQVRDTPQGQEVVRGG